MMKDEFDAFDDVEERGQKESLIETKYLGTFYKELIGTKGEAYYSICSGEWMYRPFGGNIFSEVDADELDCANDAGWVRGNYLGQKSIPKFGKASWSEGEGEAGAWVYKPKGQQKTFVIPEKEFEMVRDEDY